MHEPDFNTPEWRAREARRLKALAHLVRALIIDTDDGPSVETLLQASARLYDRALRLEPLKKLQVSLEVEEGKG